MDSSSTSLSISSKKAMKPSPLVPSGTLAINQSQQNIQPSSEVVQPPPIVSLLPLKEALMSLVAQQPPYEDEDEWDITNDDYDDYGDSDDYDEPEYGEEFIENNSWEEDEFPMDEPMGSFQCAQCLKIFSYASDKDKHQNRMHKKACFYSCPVRPRCSKRYTDLSSLKKHVLREHGQNVWDLEFAMKNNNMKQKKAKDNDAIGIQAEGLADAMPSGTSSSDEEEKMGRLTIRRHDNSPNNISPTGRMCDNPPTPSR